MGRNDFRRRANQGFTIIELLVVVIVIGILASAGIAKYQNFADMARKRTCAMNQTSIETGIAVWCTQNVDFQDNAEGFAALYTYAGYYHNPGWGTGGPLQNSYNIANVVRDNKMFKCPSHLKYYNENQAASCNWCGGYGCNGGSNQYSNYYHYWGGPGYSSWNGGGGHWYDGAGASARHSLVWCGRNGGFACNGPDNTPNTRHSMKW